LRLLLHCCCGPCSLEVAEHLRSLGHTVTAWFFNPNIHPLEELARRQATMVEAARAAGLPVGFVDPANGANAAPASGIRPADFLLLLARSSGQRCQACYQLRLGEAARAARSLGYEGFATTLTVSPYQDPEAIREIGERAAQAAGVRFVFADLREHYHCGAQRARELGLYRQNYCGCVFSLLERAERRARREIEKATR